MLLGTLNGQQGGKSSEEIEQKETKQTKGGS
jgi:hypothetical protein